MSSDATTTPRATFIGDESVWSAQPLHTDVYQLRPMLREEVSGIAKTVSQIYQFTLGFSTNWQQDAETRVTDYLNRYFVLNPHGLVNYVCEYRATDGSSHGVGFISMQTPNDRNPLNDPKHKEVESLFVHPDHSHRGVGSKLLSQIIYHAELMGGESLSASILVKMKAADKLFTKMGFV